MRISKVKLNNYVCFYGTPWFELGQGINFIVGKNNSGKTVLLDALKLDLAREPHRSQNTESLPTSGTRTSEQINYLIEYAWSENELWQAFEDWSQSQGEIYVPLHPQYSGDFRAYVEKFMAGGFGIRCAYSRDGIIQGETTLSIAGICPALTRAHDSTTHSIGFRKRNSSISAVNPEVVANGPDIVLYWLTWQDRIPGHTYPIQAERNIPATAQRSPDSTLLADASNLVSILDMIQSQNRGRFHKYLYAVQRVIPEIRDLRTVPDGSGSVTLMVDYIEPHHEQSYLGVSLEKCGSGVGQILAMLYVVITSDDPRVFIIDEPNSFLHPGAVRKLLEIFQEHNHHQFVIATHSPAAIAAVREKTILHVERKGMRSRVRVLNANDTRALGETYRSLGMRPSDILGVDALVWVEGPTEKRCFPLILETAGLQFEGVRFIPIADIGDPTGKHAKKFIAMFERVAKDVGLLPREAICIYDGDKANDLVNADTKRDVRIESLPRQNYESFFLDFPEILESVLKENAAECSPIHEGKSIREWMTENNGGRELDDTEWLNTVDGAKFLHDMFDSLGEIDYKRSKPAYGEEITKRILADSPDHFQEIVDLIQSILDENKTPDPA